MTRSLRRFGFTLIELLVVIAIIGVLMSLLLPAVQRVRESANRTKCSNSLKQVGLALHGYHDIHGTLPPALSLKETTKWYWSWMSRLMPFIEQDNLFKVAEDWAEKPGHMSPWFPMNPALYVVQPMLTCPSDSRVLVATWVTDGWTLDIAFTSYLGVSGLNQQSFNPVKPKEIDLFYVESHVRFAEITDGLSNTLMVGERPPSQDLVFGWWFAGAGEDNYGTSDVILGVNEINTYYSQCGYNKAYQFSPGTIDNDCDQYHFWSLHQGGANFLLADASVHFLNYSIPNEVMLALGTRSGGEPVQLP
jgi:prepilin-type N-terminal cleavage/methylation domain-containing protein/prepilin-type processing-associated H-X9-DG protein